MGVDISMPSPLMKNNSRPLRAQRGAEPPVLEICDRDSRQARQKSDPRALDGPPRPMHGAIGRESMDRQASRQRKSKLAAARCGHIFDEQHWSARDLERP